MKLFERLQWPWVNRKKYEVMAEASASHEREVEIWFDKYKGVEAQLSKARKGIIPKAKDPQLEAVFTDSNGVAYYRYKQPTEMPFSRIFAAQQLLTLQSAMLNPERYQKAVEAIKTEFDKGEVAEGYWMHRNLIALMKIPATEDLCLELAAVLYLREGEDPLVMDDQVKAEKIAAWKADRDTLNFFLLRSAKEHWEFSKHTGKHILQSLKENQKTALAILKELKII